MTPGEILLVEVQYRHSRDVRPCLLLACSDKAKVALISSAMDLCRPGRDLDWYTGPDRGGWTHYDAEKWANSLDVGGSKWRLPTLAELRGIYGGSKNNMDPVFKMGGWWACSSEIRNSSASLFDFYYGAEGWLDRSPANAYGRLFGVRSGRR